MRGQNKENLVTVELNQGMSGADLYMGPMGSWYYMVNARIGQHLSKRDGYTRCSTNSAGASSTLRVAGDGVYGYPPNPMFLGTAGKRNVVGLSNGGAFGKTSGAYFEFQGRVPTARPLRRRAGLQMPTIGGILDGFGTKPPSVAISSSGLIMLVGVTDDGAVLGRIEMPDGLVIGTVQIPTTSTVLRAQALNVGASAFILVWRTGVTIKAATATITGENVSWGAAGTVGTLVDATSHWDAGATGATEWFLVYNSGAGELTCSAITGTTVNHTQVLSPFQCYPLLSISPLALSAANYIWIGYLDPINGIAKYAVLSYAAAGFSVTLDLTELSATYSANWGPPLFGRYRGECSGYGNTTTAFWVMGWRAETGSYERKTRWGTATAAGVIEAASDDLCHWVPLSKPDDYHRSWFLFDNGAGTQVNSRVALIRLPNPGTSWDLPGVIELALPLFERPATANGPTSSGAWFTAQAVGAATSEATRKTLCCLPNVLNSVNGYPLVAYDICEYVTAEQDAHAAISIGPDTTLVAGSPTELFGNVADERFTGATEAASDKGGSIEVGYPHGPLIISESVEVPGTISVGTRYYRAVYQWVDGLGRRHLSEPSPPWTVTLLNASNVTLTIVGTAATQRIHTSNELSPAVILYRTLDGGETYRRLPVEVRAMERAGDCLVSLVDTYADSVIADEEVLYTDGGVKDNNLAPSCQFFARDETRIWCGGLWDPHIIQCSKTMVPDEPPLFTDAEEFQVVLDGECTGLAYQDSQLVIFTKDSVQLLGGDGPDERGGNPYGSPRVIAGGVGCINYKSVLSTDKGILFQSARGYYLLPRGFAPPHFIGAAVDDLVQSTAAYCRSSAARSGKGERIAQFLVTDSVDTSPLAPSTLLVYDIESGQWTTDEVTVATGEVQEGLGEIGVWTDGFVAAYHNLNCTTHVYPFLYQQDASAAVTDDGSTFLATTLQSNWWHPFGPGGWGQLRKVIVIYSGVHFNLELTVQTDDATQTATKAVPSGTDGIGYFCMHVARDRCSAIKIQVRDQYYGSEPATASTFRPLALLMELEDSNGVRAFALGEVA